LFIVYKEKKKKLQLPLKSVKELGEHIRSSFNIEPDLSLDIEFQDPDFLDYLVLERIKELPQKARIRVSIREPKQITRAKSAQFFIINHEEVEEKSVIGEGAFGTVYLGVWNGTDVAIKKPHTSVKGTFMSEIALLTYMIIFFFSLVLISWIILVNYHRILM